LPFLCKILDAPKGASFFDSRVEPGGVFRLVMLQVTLAGYVYRMCR